MTTQNGFVVVSSGCIRDSRMPPVVSRWIEEAGSRASSDGLDFFVEREIITHNPTTDVYRVALCVKESDPIERSYYTIGFEVHGRDAPRYSPLGTETYVTGEVKAWFEWAQKSSN